LKTIFKFQKGIEYRKICGVVQIARNTIVISMQKEAKYFNALFMVILSSIPEFATTLNFRQRRRWDDKAD